MEEILSPYFGSMVMFVKECEAAVERGALEQYRNTESEWKTDYTESR